MPSAPPSRKPPGYRPCLPSADRHSRHPVNGHLSPLCRRVLPGQADGVDFFACRLVSVRWLESGGDQDPAELAGHVRGRWPDLGGVPGARARWPSTSAGWCPAVAYQVMAMLWQASSKGTVRRTACAVRLRACRCRRPASRLLSRSQSATADARQGETISSASGTSGPILSAGALLQAGALAARLLAAAGDPDATEHRNDSGSRPDDLGGGPRGTAGDGGVAAGDARGEGRGRDGRRSR